VPTISPVLVLFLVALGVVLFIAWLVLPFAMFGIKPLLREILAELRRTREILERTTDATKPAGLGPPPSR